jgi:hypothetical protein
MTMFEELSDQELSHRVGAMISDACMDAFCAFPYDQYPEYDQDLIEEVSSRMGRAVGPDDMVIINAWAYGKYTDASYLDLYSMIDSGDEYALNEAHNRGCCYQLAADAANWCYDRHIKSLGG